MSVVVVHPVLGSIVNLNGPDHYIHWGFVLISLANLLVIVAMVVVFVAALLLPFVHGRRKGASKSALPAPPDPGVSAVPVPAAANPSASGPGETEQRGEADAWPGEGGDATLWTARVRRLWMRHLPPDKLLPDSQPAYVASWIYVFGVLTLAALAVVIATGCVLALEGPAWWHASSVGLFFNSLHLWSVECFFAFMAIHLWGKYWMASWRGRRHLTWMTGVAAFLVAVFEGFTGYVSQTNFDAQWIAFESKDAMNGAGIGAFFNTMNFGQALMLHIVVVPLVIVVIVAIHIVMVRLRGVAPPIDALPDHLGAPSGNAATVAAATSAADTDADADATTAAGATTGGRGGRSALEPAGRSGSQP